MPNPAELSVSVSGEIYSFMPMESTQSHFIIMTNHLLLILITTIMAQHEVKMAFHSLSALSMMTSVAVYDPSSE